MIRHCEHVKANGHFCGSPAMRGRNYCFFHITHIGQRLRLERYASLGLEPPAIELPLLEDAASIQLALMQVTDALLKGTLDAKRGGLVLYALQTASSNLRNMAKAAKEEESAAVCNRYDSFEQDYELDQAATAGLRVEDPVEKQEAEAAEKARAALQNESNGEATGEAAGPKYDSAMALIAKGEAMGFLHTKGVCMPSKSGAEDGPRRLTDREAEDKRVRIPMNLSETQYLQAKSSIEEYEEQHNIDAQHPKGRKPVAQRAAISQKISLGARRPVQSATMEDDAVVACNE
jgi:hypothetical protein